MIIDIYSFEKLDINVRSSFELPSYPNGDYHSFFEDYLRQMSVFRFTCTDIEVCPREILIKREIEQEISFPFDCYFNSCAISDTDLSILDWPNDSPEGHDLHRKLMQHPIAKDNKAWFSWNVKVSVSELRSGCIKTDIVQGQSELIQASRRLETL
jgi:hypothetical protein